MSLNYFGIKEFPHMTFLRSLFNIEDFTLLRDMRCMKKEYSKRVSIYVLKKMIVKSPGVGVYLSLDLITFMSSNHRYVEDFDDS